MREAAPGRRSSFRTRLTTSMITLSLGLLTFTSAVIYFGVRRALLSNLESVLLTMARVEAGSAEDVPGLGIHVHDGPPLPILVGNELGYTTFALIRDRQGRVRARTPGLERGPEPRTDKGLEARALSGRASFADLSRGDEVFRGVYYPLTAADGEPLMMVVAISRQPLEHSLNALLGVLAVTLILGGAATAASARRIARRLTGPLEQIARAARQVGEENLGTRIPEVAADRELHTVATLLNQMLSRLERAFEAKRRMVTAQRRFIADASHELRSPLTNLRGTLEVALRRPRSPERYQEVLTLSLTEIERLSRLANELLALTRAESGRAWLRPALCDLALLADLAVRAYQVRAAEARIRIRLEASEPLMVTVDADRVREVIDNLLENAVRYAPAGSEVVVAVRRVEGAALLSVRDEGPGLSAEEQAHVFDRFYRSELARACHAGGHGLGLAISLAIAEAHRGTLTVESQPGAGAVFTLRLPDGMDAPDPAIYDSGDTGDAPEPR